VPRPVYLNGYIGPLATSGGLVTFMREQLGKPIPSPVVLGQVTEKFRDAVKAMAEQQHANGDPTFLQRSQEVGRSGMPREARPEKSRFPWCWTVPNSAHTG
jgi:hypothetical protein